LEIDEPESPPCTAETNLLVPAGELLAINSEIEARSMSRASSFLRMSMEQPPENAPGAALG
jgi:hypothetical protein